MNCARPPRKAIALPSDAARRRKAREIVQQSFKNGGRQLLKIDDRLPTVTFSLPSGTL